MTLYLNDMGVIGPLGADKRQVLAGLLSSDGSGLTPYGELITGRTTMIGRVRAELPPPPPGFAELDCRNNRLLAHALGQIAASVAEIRETLGAERIAVVLGTSTSGIAAGEQAMTALVRERRLPSAYHYRQQGLEPADKNQQDFVAAMQGTAGVEVKAAEFYPAPPPAAGRGGGRGGE